MRTLHIFVEGKNDERFFEEFIKQKNCFPISITQRDNSYIEYDNFVYYKYRDLSKGEIKAALKTITDENADYIVIADKDFKEENQRKKEIIKVNPFDIDKVWLVSNVMEGWYLAGFDKTFCERGGIRIKYNINTEQVSKSDFKSIGKKIRKSPEQLFTFLIKNKSDYTFKEVRNNQRNKSLIKLSNYFNLNC